MRIGIDTNVLVRFLTGDDPKQSRAAERLLERHCSGDSPGWINLVVLCELVWVLQRGYGYSRQEIAAVIEGLLNTVSLEVEDVGAVRAAIEVYQNGGADFADGLVAVRNKKAGAEVTYTFDRKAAKIGGMKLIRS